MSFKTHDKNSAPEQSKELLEQVEKNMGFVPNIMGVFAQAPAVLESYLKLSELISKTSFSKTEKEIVLLTASAHNGCPYCMAAHTTLAKQEGVSDDVLENLRKGEPLNDKKLEALRQYTKGILDNEGHPGDEAKQEFIKQGYGPQQALEIVLGIAMKTLSNYTNHLAHTQIDKEFEDNKISTEALKKAA